MKRELSELEKWQNQLFGYITDTDKIFLNHIRPMPGLKESTCADIYRRGYKARLLEVLGDTFEASWWVLGDENYFSLAGQFVENIPSRSFDLSDYGLEFPEFLRSTSENKEIPFLSELARFEWLFKEMFHSTDMDRHDEKILSRLSAQPDAPLLIKPSVKLWSSKYSIYEIWKLRSTTDVSQVHEIEWNKSQHLVLQKVDSNVLVTNLGEMEFNLLSFFQKPASIEEAVERYQKEFGTLLPETIQNLFSEVGELGILSIR